MHTLYKYPPVSHLVPVKWSGQSHCAPAGVSLHVPPFAHVVGVHVSASEINKLHVSLTKM